MSKVTKCDGCGRILEDGEEYVEMLGTVLGDVDLCTTCYEKVLELREALSITE